MENSENPTKILLVEGNDDQHIAEHIWYAHSHESQLPFHIKNSKGIDRLLSSLPVELKNMYLQSIGILIDANAEPIKRWNQILRSIAENIPIDVRVRPNNHGTIIDSDTIKVGIWLMPDNESTGEIEDFISHLIPKNDPMCPLAEQYIDDILS